MTDKFTVDKDEPSPVFFRQLAAAQAGVFARIFVLVGMDGELARDVLQETNLFLCTHACEWDPGRASVATWATAVAVNKACKARERRCNALLVFSGDMLDRFAEQQPDAADDRLPMLHLCLKKLPAQERKLVAMCYFKELPLAEICERLSIGRSAAKMRLLRSRKALGRCIAEAQCRLAKGELELPEVSQDFEEWRDETALSLYALGLLVFTARQRRLDAKRRLDVFRRWLRPIGTAACLAGTVALAFSFFPTSETETRTYVRISPTFNAKDPDMNTNNVIRTSVLAAASAVALTATVPAKAGGLLYETDAYVQDGLVLHLDGIRNAGALRPHDSTAETWTDLSPRGDSAAFVRRVASDTSAWDETGYSFAGKSYAMLTIGTPAMSQLSLEMFGDFTANSGNYPNYISAYWLNKDFGVFTGGTTLSWKVDNFGGTNGTRPGKNPWDGSGFTFIASDTTTAGYFGGTKSVKTRNSEVTLPVCRWVIMNTGSSANMMTGTDYSRQAKGLVQSVRIYNRPLTEEEIAQNRQLDTWRYVTGIPVTNAVIASAVAGLHGTEGNGVYAVDGEYTFTAPAFAEVGGKKYALSGYTLEKWKNDTWETPSEYTAFSCRVVADEKVRITWQWAETQNSPGFVDAANVVQDGLVMHFDAIRNDGISAPHRANTLRWRDLSAKVNDAVFTVPEGSSSAWRDNAFYFAGDAKANLLNTCAFGRPLSLQSVSTINCAEQVKGWTIIFTGADDMVDLFTRSQVNLHFKVDAITGQSLGNRSVISKWQGRYATAILDEERTACFEGLEPNWLPATNGGEPGDRSYTIGTDLIGSIHALRMYDHVLSSDELAHNRKIDNARYFGIPAEKGMVVVAEDANGFYGREVAGVYQPDGWIFAAGLVDCGINAYEAVGYNLQTWKSSQNAWGEPVAYDGNTFTPSGTEFDSVRLSWRWKQVRGIVEHSEDATELSGDMNLLLVARYDATAEAPGAYEVAGEYTFSATDATVDGKTRKLLGYTLETWNGTGWSGKTFHSGSKYIWRESECPSPVRLVWLWQGSGTVISLI